MNQSAHQIEPELREPVPRRLRRRTGSYGLAASLVLISLAIIFVGCVLMKKTYYTALAKYRGVSVAAQIVGHFTSTIPRNGVSYHLRYRYGWNGNTYENSDTVTRQKYEDLPDGSSAQARIWPLRPDVASYLVFSDGSDGASLVWLLLSAIVIAALGLCLPVNWMIEDRKQRRLLKNGTPVVARIEGVGQAAEKILSYVYNDEKSGKEFCNTVSLNTQTSLSNNNCATVLYDPHNPQNSMLYAVRAYEIAPRG